MTLKDFTLTDNNNFVVYQSHRFFFKRIYLVLITKNYLIGLVCNNNLNTEHGDKVLGNHQIRKELPERGSLLNPYSYLKAKFIRKIEGKYFFDKSIYAVDSDNFRIDRNDIQSVIHDDTEVSLGNYPNVGRLTLETKKGFKKDFILIGKQNGKEVVEFILTRDEDAVLN